MIALPGNPFGEHSLRPDEFHAELAGPGQDFYQTYFGALGAVIEEFERDARGWIRDIVYTVSGDGLLEAGVDLRAADPVTMIRNSALCIPHGARMRDRFLVPATLRAWFNEADLEVFATEFERTGLAGPLCYYRNIDASWHDLADQSGQPLTVPAFFLGADLDVGTWWGQEAIERAPEKITNWLGCRLLEGCGHWIQQERPDETNALSWISCEAYSAEPQEIEVRSVWGWTRSRKRVRRRGTVSSSPPRSLRRDRPGYGEGTDRIRSSKTIGARGTLARWSFSCRRSASEPNISNKAARIACGGLDEVRQIDEAGETKRLVSSVPRGPAPHGHPRQASNLGVGVRSGWPRERLI